MTAARIIAEAGGGWRSNLATATLRTFWLTEPITHEKTRPP
jgi:hypothetical protein